MITCNVVPASPRDVRRIEDLNRTTNWMNQNLIDLLDKYEGKLVVIKGTEVVASVSNIDKLEPLLKDKGLIGDSSVNILKASWETFKTIL